jgi:hypothetical protein
MKSPVTSITDEQLAEIEKEFGRNSPCPHHNREPIGFGHYHRCHDCGRDVPSEMLDKAQAASDRHDDLQVILRDAFARLRAAEADAKRLQHLIDNGACLIYMGGHENERAAIDAAMERKA